MKKERLLYSIITVGFMLLLFCISSSLKFAGLTQPKLFGLFILGCFVLLFFLKKVSFKKDKNLLENIFSFFLLLFSFFVTISIIINKKFALTYLFEIIRPLLYILSIFIFISLYKDRKNINVFNKIFYILIIILFAINIIQFHNIGNVNDLYIKTIAPTQYKTLVDGYAYPRVVGLMSNPNAYGFVLAMFNLYIFYLLLKNIKIKKNSLCLLIILLLNKVSLYMTGSRTSFLVCILSELLFVFLYYIFKEKKDKIKLYLKPFLRSSLICIGILVAEAALLFALPSAYTWRIKTLFVGNVDSFIIRQDKNKDVLNNIINKDKDNENEHTESKDPNLSEKEDNKVSSKPFIDSKIGTVVYGKGPQKEGFAYDNEYIHTFVSFGVLGLLAFICMFLVPISTFKKNNLLFNIYYISIISLNLIYIYAAGTFYSYNLFISLLLFIFLVYTGEQYAK